MSISDSDWSLQTYDLSATADDQSTVYVRWGYEIGSGAYAYSGWNIDDVQIAAVPSFEWGDVNCDGSINNFDIDAFVAALTDPSGYAATYPDCNRTLADCDRNGGVDNFDIDAFVDLLAG